MANPLSWFRRIGTGLYVAAALIFATVVACIRFYFMGRASERDDQEISHAKGEAAEVKKAGQRGDADSVLDSFRRATDKRRK